VACLTNLSFAVSKSSPFLNKGIYFFDQL